MANRPQFIVVHDREVHVTEWVPTRLAGKRSDTDEIRALPVLVCWHGLLRTGRDYDELAAYFADRHGYRVICPDTIGRGLSQWSPLPDEEYTVPFYIKLLVSLLDVLHVSGPLDFLGTSMGGIIGFGAASTVLQGRIRRLVLVDVGPQLNPVALERIKQYATAKVVVDRASDMEKLFRVIYKPFGPVSDTWMHRITTVGVRRLPDGKFTTHYDPEVTLMLNRPSVSLTHGDPWAVYDAVSCPVLIVRGADSDLLLQADAEAMLRRGPKDSQLVVIEGCGHAPSLEPESQRGLIEAFFTTESGAVPGAVRGSPAS